MGAGPVGSSTRRHTSASIPSPAPVFLSSEGAPSHALFRSLPPGSWGFPRGLVVKNLPAMQEIAGSILGSGRSPGEGNGNPL